MTQPEMMSLTEDDLLCRFGAELEDEPVLGVSNLKRVFILRAQKWWDDNTEKIQDAVCRSSKIKALVQSEKCSERDLYIALIEVLSTVFLGVPVAVLAAICIRRGVSSICRVHWSDTG